MLDAFARESSDFRCLYEPYAKAPEYRLVCFYKKNTRIPIPGSIDDVGKQQGSLGGSESK
jgi:hypothetical protein